jgi:uncharacterized protein (TIRG00374 family)
VSLLKKHGVKLVVSTTIALGFVWLLNAGALPILPDSQALLQFKWWTLGGYLLLWSLVHWLRAVRWHYLLAPIAQVPMTKLLTTSFVGFAAIVLLPMRAGEVVRPALVREKGTLSGWSALGTVGAERIADGLVLSLMLLFGLLTSDSLSPLPEQIGDSGISPQVVPIGTYFALAVFGSAFVVMGVFYWKRAFALGLVNRSVGWVSRPLASWLTFRIDRVCTGLSFLPRPKENAAFMGLTAAYWLLNALATWLLGYGVGLEMTYGQACVLAGVLALGIMVPNAPGFFGAFQVSVYAGLSLYVPKDQLLHLGSVLVFFLYVGQMAIIFGAALLSLPWLKGSLSQALSGGQDALEQDEG